MTEFRAWAAEWADIASVLGLILAIIGFGITIFGVWRSKSAAEQARQAAQAARESIANYDAVAELSAILAIMDEIKRHQLSRNWTVLPDRYAVLQRHLAGVHGSQAVLADGDRQTLQLAIQTFADLERRVGRAVASTGTPPSPDKLNEIVITQTNEVHRGLLALQRTLRSR